MKKLQLIIILLFCVQGLKSQAPFWKLTHLGWGTQLLEKGDTIITIGTGSDTTYLVSTFHLNKYLRNGDRISKWLIYHDPSLYDGGSTGTRVSNTLVKLYNNTYAWGGVLRWRYDSIPEGQKCINRTSIFSYRNEKNNDYIQWTNAVIFNVNSQLDSVLNTQIFSPDMFYAEVCALHQKHPDTLLILFRENTDGELSSLGIRLVETDANYNERWSRKITFGEVINTPTSFLPLRDGGCFVIMDLRLVNYSFNNDQQMLIKFSKTGQVVFKRPIGNSSKHTNRYAQIINLDDGNFLVTYTNPDSLYYDIWGVLKPLPNDSGTIWFQKMDINGNVLKKSHIRNRISWVMSAFGEQIYQTFYATGISKAEDGDILISGHNDWYHYRGFLIKLRQEDFSPQWIRIYEIDKENYPYADHNYFSPGRFYTLTDGRLAAHGSFNTQPSFLYPQGMQGGVLLVTDSLGCLEPGCHLHDNIQEIDLRQGFVIYPNPAHNRLWVSVAPENQHAPIHLDMYDFNGRKVLSHSPFSFPHALDIAHLPPGIYLIQLHSKGKAIGTKKVVKF